MADPHLPQHEPPVGKSPTTLVSNILVITGFIILLIIIVWGLFHIASLSTGWFSNLFRAANIKGTFIMRAPESTVSGRAAQISWEHVSDGGRYAFLYECTEGLEFGIPLLKDGETTPTLARIPCGTAFTLGNATSSLLVVPILAGTEPITAQMNIVYVPAESGAEASGGAQMIVTSTAAPVQSEPSKPEPVALAPSESSAPAVGPADLVVSVISASTDYGGYSTVSFDIANVGASSSGTYYFTATLPTGQPYTYRSEAQASLAPGDRIVNTLRFTNTISGIFTAVVDPTDIVRESSEINNVTSREILR